MDGIMEDLRKLADNLGDDAWMFEDDEGQGPRVAFLQKNFM